jgi:hypothetical protein
MIGGLTSCTRMAPGPGAVAELHWGRQKHGSWVLDSFDPFHHHPLLFHFQDGRASNAAMKRLPFLVTLCGAVHLAYAAANASLAPLAIPASLYW